MGPLAHAFLAARQEQQPCASTGSSHGYQGNRILKALSEQAKKKVEEEKSDGESPLPKTPLNNETHEVIGDLVLPCLYVLGRIEVERCNSSVRLGRWARIFLVRGLLWRCLLPVGYP